jgi:hypothetical protein
MLPRQSANEAVVAGLSVAGFVSLLMLLIGLVDTVEAGVGLILVLVTSVRQASLAVGWVLFSARGREAELVGPVRVRRSGRVRLAADPPATAARPAASPTSHRSPTSRTGRSSRRLRITGLRVPPPRLKCRICHLTTGPPRVQQPKANDPTQQV